MKFREKKACTIVSNKKTWIQDLKPRKVKLLIKSIHVFLVYHISFNKRPRFLLNFETVRCGAY